VDVNLSHFLSSADLEHGAHFTALPTPWCSGVSTGGAALRIGSETAWILPPADARAGMLEYTGTGLGALEKRLEAKERQMAILGARLLEGQKPGVEAADTVRMRHAGDDAVLKTIAMTVSHAVTKMIRWHVWWLALVDDPDSTDIGYTINTDFFATRLDAPTLTALLQLWQGDAISFETLYYNLARGDVARPGVPVEDEQKLVEAQALKTQQESLDNQAAMMEMASSFAEPTPAGPAGKPPSSE
jgi:hypothetical protein